MTPGDATRGSQAAYDFWLGLIPQFLALFGGNPAGVAAAASAGAGAGAGLPFPVDQIAKAAAITQQSLAGLGEAIAPMLQAGGAGNLLGQWASAMPAAAFGKPGDAAASASSAAQALFAPWTALMSNAAAAMPAAAWMPPAAGGTAMPQGPLQAISQTWVDMASRLAGASPGQIDTGFDRAFGALSDGLGLGPLRKLQAAWRDVLAAGVAQQDARMKYATLVQGALAQGSQRLLTALAAMADAGQRIDSVLALIRLWAVNTEQAVHETLQSERGLAATAALIRSDLAYRRRMQQVAAVLAEQFDMASRRELDVAYREIQALKRSLRTMRPVPDAEVPPRRAASAKSKRSKDTRPQSEPRDV